MRFLNVLSALVVLGCAVWLSLHHTHALFMGVGFNSRDAWVATLLSETLFLTGGLNLANSRLRGYTPSVPAYLGFIQGVLLVGASNIVATWEYGLDGWLLGGSIVTAVLISEAIMTAETKKKKADENAEQEPEKKAENDQPKNPTDRPDHHNQPEQPDRPNHPTTQREQADQPNNQPEQPTAQTDGIDRPDGIDQPTDQPTGATQTTQNDETAQADGTEETDQTDKPTTPYEWAVHEYKRTGKVPTRRGLAKLAGCSEWKAGNAKKQLEEELGLAG